MTADDEGREVLADTPVGRVAEPWAPKDARGRILADILDFRARVRNELPRDSHQVKMAMDRLTEAHAWLRDLDPGVVETDAAVRRV